MHAFLPLSIFVQLKVTEFTLIYGHKGSPLYTCHITTTRCLCLDIMVLSNHHFTSSIYLLSPVFVQWVNVEAYNFQDVKRLFRTDVFWWCRLSPLSVHPSMMLSICVEGNWGFRGC